MTTKILPVLLLFLLILYVFSAADLAVAGSLILASVLFQFSAVWLFTTAFLFFVGYIASQVFNIHFDFVADLSIASYVLFVSGLALFFIRGEKITQSLAHLKGDILKFGGMVLLTLLIYPLVGLTLALVLGYGGFIIAFPRYRSNRWSFIVAILFLIGCPIFLITKQDVMAVQSATLAYIFLIIGVFQVLANSVGQKKSPKELVHPL